MKARPSLIGLLCSLAAWAHADTVALTSNRTVGNQTWTGTLGMDFNVFSSITVTWLGAFDSGLNGFSSPIQVGIFNRTTQALVGSSVILSGVAQPLIGSMRFFDVPDFVLVPGNYTIVAVGFGANDPNGNVFPSGPAPTIDSGGGAIGFVGTSRWSSSTSLVFPANLDNISAAGYDAGTFMFISSIPELSDRISLSVGLSIVGVVALRRRRKSISAVPS